MRKEGEIEHKGLHGMRERNSSHTCMCVHVGMCVFMHLLVSAFVHTFVHRCVHLYVFVNLCAEVHAFLYRSVCMYFSSPGHTHIQTHT